MRLIKTYSNGNITIDAAQFGIDQAVLDTEINNSEPIKAAVKRLAEYEDAEERGTLIHLPCKVGDTVYCIVKGFENPFKGRVFEINIREKIIIRVALKGFFGQAYMIDQIGKTVFLTREEAEQALKAREK